MPLSLYDGVDTVTLPNDLEWQDEYEWDTIRQDIQPMIGGGRVISENTVTTGRPITLVSGDEVWIAKSVLDDLFDMLNNTDKSMTLTLPDARTFTVMFDRSEGTPVEAKPIWRKRIQEDTDYYTLTIKLMEV
jgi:hypothetical protein